MMLMFQPLRKYFDFTGRARRAEYWLFQLFIWVASILISIVETAVFFSGTSGYSGAGEAYFNLGGPVSGIFSLAVLIPNIAVGVRRLHDRDMRGWWLLLVFVPFFGWIALIILFCLKGTNGKNRFGGDPLRKARS